MPETKLSVPDLDFNSSRAVRLRKYRYIKDRLAELGIGIGGVSVIGAVLLIMFYLLYEVQPLFSSPHIELVTDYPVPVSQSGQAQTLHMAIEEQSEVALRVTNQAELLFFSTKNGELIKQHQLLLPPGTSLTSFSHDAPERQLLAFGLSDGSVLVVRHEYEVSYPNDVRLITPQVSYPYGAEPLLLNSNRQAVRGLIITDGEDSLSIAALDDNNGIHLSQYTKNENLFTEELELERSKADLPKFNWPIKSLHIDGSQRWLIVINEDSQASVYDLRDLDAVQLNAVVPLTEGSEVTTATFLLGGISLLVGDNQGNIAQWFMVRDEDNQYALKKVREFADEDRGAILQIESEQRRKGFLVSSAEGWVGAFHSTANSTLINERLVSEEIRRITVSPRGQSLLVESLDGRLHYWHIDNEYPEVSWQALWTQVWYENYDEPKYIWQSSAATQDFEPKYSIVPLAYGTLKAAFYAMLIATPLAIAGAVYTAYFMAPALRRRVKPIIELMEALPTVILGFLAGLALAPFLEGNMPGVFAMLLLLPVSIIGFGFLWANMPRRIRLAVPEGWDAALLVPVVCLVGWFAIAIGPSLETSLFNGNMVFWLTNDLGVDYSQRNAMVVGFAMGFAVIPTIFSIAEDAVFSVPKHLTFGSLALGATPWQTLTRVVLPTASPGIFSALMIGMGRAVGETMIVLMATGNTPIMDSNIFEGMRTLAANIAVEIGETEVGSSHYRILFLTGLVLFFFTFVVNTLAETVRARLRARYSQM